MTLMEKALAYGHTLPREEGLAVVIIVTDIKTGQLGWVSSLSGNDSIVLMANCLSAIVTSRAS